MRLERIADVAYRAALPVRAVDKTIKLGFDAFTAATAKIGFDRFDLANYAVVGQAATLSIAGVGYGLAYKPTYSSFFAFLSFIQLRNLSFTNTARDYSSKPKDVLNEDVESTLRWFRGLRYIAIGSIAAGAIARAIGIDVPPEFEKMLFPNKLSEIGMITSGAIGISYLYLIDGDHALWDKTKATAKQALQRAKRAKSLVPHRTPTPNPSPHPEPAISYNATYSSSA